MIQELRSKTMKTIIIRMVIGLFTIGICAIIFVPSIIKMFEAKDINSIPLDSLENTYVKGDIYNNYGNFYYFYETNKRGQERDTANYYIIPIGDEEYCAMVLENNFTTAEQIYNETYDYINGDIDTITTSLSVSGTFEKMDTAIYTAYKDFFVQSGFTQEEIDQLALPYVLVVNKVDEFNTTTLYIALGVMGLSLIFIIINLVNGLTGRTIINVRRKINEEGSANAEEKLETDYQNAFIVKNLRIGQKYTFFAIGAKAYVLYNRDITWAYLQNVTQRVYGIKTATHRSIIIHDNLKKKYAIPIRKEQDILSALNYYSSNHQNIVIGYNDELKKIYKKDYDYFLTLAKEQYVNTENSSNYKSEL
ncbi:MAG: hypothetical protein K0S61_1155 [Anaerocolumna sp.]|nr:hypothetical protein [Anaerocolumna sp.]